MAVTNEQFLFCCIAHSNNGAINWQAVADTCGISSKGAASKKYHRMRAKFGTTDTGGQTAARLENATDEAEKPNKTMEKPAQKTRSKKRKVHEDDGKVDKEKLV